MRDNPCLRGYLLSSQKERGVIVKPRKCLWRFVLKKKKKQTNESILFWGCKKQKKVLLIINPLLFSHWKKNRKRIFKLSIYSLRLDLRNSIKFISNPLPFLPAAQEVTCVSDRECWRAWLPVGWFHQRSEEFCKPDDSFGPAIPVSFS